MSDRIKNRFILWDTSPDGNNSRVIPANFTPTAYTPAQVGSEGADKISAHLNGVNTALSVLQNLPPQNVVKVQKNPGPGQFSSIAAALASITTAASDNPFKIEVEPGVYTEPLIVSKPFVYICGSVIETVVVEPAGDHDVFQLSDNTSLNFLTIVNAPAGRRGIYVEGAENGIVLHKLTLNGCDIGIEIVATTASELPNYLYAEYVDITGGTTAFRVHSEDGEVCFASIENFFVFANGSNPANAIQVSGPGSRVIGQAVKLEGEDQTGTGIEVTNGGQVEFSATTISKWNVGVHSINDGAGPTILVDVIVIDSDSRDILIEHPGSVGSIAGSADYTKVQIDPDAAIGAAYNNNMASGDVGTVVTRSLMQGDRHDRLLNLSLLARRASTMGLLSGGALSVGSGLDLAVSSGQGFLHDQVGDYIKQVTWGGTIISVPDDSASYIIVNANEVVVAVSALGPYIDAVVLGRVIARDGEIIAVERSSIKMDHYSNKVELFSREALGPIFASGSIVSESGTRNLDVTQGRYFYGSTGYMPSGGEEIEFTAFYRDGSSGFSVIENQTTVDNANYDNGTGTLEPLTADYYAKHALYLLGDGADEIYMLVYAQAEYDSLVAVEGADIPIPPTSFTDAVVLIATIIVQEGEAALVKVRDERPVIGFKASGVSASSDHGNLSGLGDDDHLQYLLVSGSRAMSGSLNMGGNSITNVNLVDGVDVSAHAARHQPNGSDPLPTAAAVNVAPNNTNGAGTSNSFSRADHVHALPSAAAAAQTPDQTAAAGTANTVARSDHVHNIPTATAVGLTADSTNAQGDAATFARSNHTHAIATGAASGQTPDQTNAAGSSANLARADHVHNIPTAAAVNIGVANAQGDAATFARSNHVHQGVHGLRVNSGDYRFGDISLAAGSGVTIVDSGTGIFTIDTVAGPNQLRVTYPGSGLDVNYTGGLVLINGVYTPIAGGSLALTGSVADGRIYVDTDGSVAASNTTTIPPNAVPLASFTTDATDVTDLADIRTFINQNLVFGIADDIASVASGAAAAAGTSNRYARADHKHNIATATAAAQTPDQTAAEGVSTSLARADHVHNIPTAAAVTVDATTSNAQGSASTFARSDHGHAIPTAVSVAVLPDQGNIIGTSASLSRADHRHNAPTAAPVALVAGGSNVQGTANSFSRSDHVHQAPTAAPSANLTATTTNAEGASTSFSRADHSHAISTAAVVTQTPDQTNAAGTAVELARADHVHNIPTAAAVGLSATTTNAQGDAASFARSNHTHAIATGVVSAQTPDQTNAAGTSANLARADHVHNIPTAAAVTLNAASTNTQGNAATFARSNHTHAITTAAAIAQIPDQSNAAGTADGLARADHVHNIPTAAAVGLSTSSISAQGDAATFARSNHTHAISLVNDQATATANTTTTSATDVLIAGMTLTPVAGTYLVMFSTSLQSNTNGSVVTVNLYVGGSIVAHSEREAQPQFSAGGLGGSPSIQIPVATQAIVTVNGSQAIEARWRRGSGTATAMERTLSIVKLSN